MISTTVSIWFAIAAFSSISLAQTSGLDSGTKVRVTPVGFESERVIGTLVSANADGVAFTPSGTAYVTSLPTAQVKRLEVANGKHTHKWRGFLIGFASGAILGGGLTAATWKKPGGEFDFGRWGDAAFVGVPSAVLGGLIGLLIGVPASETWKTVSLPKS
jgi:hypothetical protein